MGCSSSANNTITLDPPKPESVGRGSEKGPQTFHDAYYLGPKLGRGAFAQVRIATRAGSNDASKSNPKAVKIIDLRDKANPQESNRQQTKAAQAEATIWQKVGEHDNVIRLYETFFGQQLCYLVMEKCASGLLQAIESTPDWNEASLSRVLVQMLQGLKHVHKAKIIHRDVKPDNFLCGGDRGQVVKLGDFGLSAILPSSGGVSGVFGTAPFMCPEMLAGRWYNDRSDVWSVAVIAYALLFGNFPYMPKEQSSKGMKQAILDGSKPPKFESALRQHQNLRYSKNAVSFCQALLNRDPEQRPSCSEAMNLPYMLQAAGDPHTEPFAAELPSLRPFLHAAKKVGAFEVRDPSRDDRTDSLLNSLQMKHLNVPLPQTMPNSGSGHRSRGEDRKPAQKDPAFTNASKSQVSRTPPPGCAWENSSVTTKSTCASSDNTDNEWSFKGSGWSKTTPLQSVNGNSAPNSAPSSCHVSQRSS